MKYILGVFLILVIAMGSSVFRRNRKMVKWAVSQSLSTNQLKVLEDLAAAEHVHKAPEKDPLDSLSTEEKAELLYLCSPSGPPKELVRGGERFWIAFVIRAKGMGFNEDQAMILAGIENNRLHPKYRAKLD